MRNRLLLLVGAFVVLAACAASTPETMASLDAVDAHGALDVPPPKLPQSDNLLLKGKMSLVELREASVAAASGQEVMSQHMEEQAKHNFIKLAAQFKSDKLKAQSIATVRLAQQVLLGEGTDSTKRSLGEGAKTGTQGGLDLIFYKLNELRDEIKNEQKEALTTITDGRAECQRMIADANAIIASSSGTMYENYKQVEEAKTQTIPNHQKLWDDSRALEDSTHATLAGEQADRASNAALVRSEVNEKTKAVDVLVKAAFLVCERFPRYKPTQQCKEIRSQPDVDEPQRYETKVSADAKADTIADHASKLETGDDNPWYIKWEAQKVKDEAKVGHKDPEELMGASYPAAGPPPDQPAVTVEEEETVETNAVELVDVTQDDDDETYALSETEVNAAKELENMGKKADLKHRYAMPLVELGEAIKSGNMRRSKSIVQILLDVLNEIREEIAVAKATFQVTMDDYFARSIDYELIMKDCTTDQADHKTVLEENRLMILDKMAESEDERQAQNKARSARTTTQDSCWADEEEFGIQEAINMEDLENLIKLKSLLRGLYDKKMPKACPKHNGVTCTSFDAGWCVFEQEKASQGNDQRCSCNVGTYGPACQFKMCPGLAQNLYTASGEGSDGVCSERGTCNPITGLCTCRPEFYHGPKNACDYKHAPPSKNGLIDNQCTDERGRLDKVRGFCNCDVPYYGSGCQEKRCPNSNGVLYPMESANACNGHGACNIDTGLCSCSHPYYHEESDGSGSCNLERCQDNCSGRGSCNPLSGRCVCTPADKYDGPNDACRWTLCNKGDGCGGQASGWCNRNDGICLCHMGFSGYKCDRTSRCEAAPLHNNDMNWWTIWDKPGWLVCPKGQLMWKLKRSNCQALSCLESGGCSAACEGEEHVFQLRHCYHDLRWYLAFDEAGWAKCLDDYFVAGLFRSCESLYCLNMAKCCSLKEARQPGATCGTTIWNSDFDNGAVPVNVPDNTFITGFRRSEGHQLKNIESASYCGFVRGY